MDRFLKNVGIVARRKLAQEACRRGLIELDGRPAKSASSVHVGQDLTVRLGMRLRRYRILSVPVCPVARAERSECVELMHEEPISLDDFEDEGPE